MQGDEAIGKSENASVQKKLSEQERKSSWLVFETAGVARMASVLNNLNQVGYVKIKMAVQKILRFGNEAVL